MGMEGNLEKSKYGIQILSLGLIVEAAVVPDPKLEGSCKWYNAQQPDRELTGTPATIGTIKGAIPKGVTLENSYGRCGTSVTYRTTGAVWPSSGWTAHNYALGDVYATATCSAGYSVTPDKVNCPALNMTLGGCVAWNGSTQLQVPNGDCIDLTYTTPGNDDNGYFFQCATPSLSNSNNCFRELSVNGSVINTKSGSCNEGVGTNTTVYFNLTGPKPGSGVLFEKENITIQAFTANANYTCLPALGNGQTYAHGVNSICDGGVAKWTNYECSDSNYGSAGWLGWTSFCGKNTKVNAFECISGAVERSECSATKYATVTYGNKTLNEVNITCKIKANNGNNW